jgi:hypothetical protein
MSATCCSLTCRTTRAGCPRTSEFGGISFPSGTSVLAPIRQFSPMFAPLSRVDPIPMSALSPIVTEWRMTLCPMVTFAPTIAGWPGSV